MPDEPMKDSVFSELEERLASLESKDASKVRRDRWVVMTMLAGTTMTLPVIFGARWPWLTWITLLGLVLEVCGFAVFAYRQIRDVAPEFVDAKLKFARELDVGFHENEQILAWLRSLPLEVRDRRLGYLESRLDSMAHRYPIVFGAVDKLGFLPLLVGFLIQVQAIKTVSTVTGIVAVAILALYGMSIWMARFRLQMQAYVRLLQAASSQSKGGRNQKGTQKGVREH